MHRWTRRFSFAYVALVVVACSGGNNGTGEQASTLESPENLVVKIESKYLSLSWDSMAEATHYHAFWVRGENREITTIAKNLRQPTLGIQIPLTQVNEQSDVIAVAACDRRGCGQRTELSMLDYYDQLGEVIHSPEGAPHERFGKSIALSGDGQVLAVGSDGTPPDRITTFEDLGRRSGVVYIYTKYKGRWQRSQTVIPATDELSGDFGSSLSLSDNGSILVVGAPTVRLATTASGVVNVLVRVNNQWIRSIRLRSSLYHEPVKFGHSVAISGDGNTLIVGAPIDSASSASALSSKGSAEVFGQTGSAWQQLQRLVPNADAGHHFGTAVATSVSGDSIVISDPSHTDNTGAVLVFEKGVSRWDEQALLQPTQANRDSDFGRSVDTDATGKRIIIGAPLASGKGAAYLYKHEQSAWVQELVAAPNGTDDTFRLGQAVVLSRKGDRMFIGAERAASVWRPQRERFVDASGALIQYEIMAGIWRQGSVITSIAPTPGDRFGAAIALSTDGSTLVAGSPADKTNGGKNRYANALEQAGAVFLY